MPIFTISMYIWIYGRYSDMDIGYNGTIQIPGKFLDMVPPYFNPFLGIFGNSYCHILKSVTDREKRFPPAQNTPKIIVSSKLHNFWLFLSDSVNKIYRKKRWSFKGQFGEFLKNQIRNACKRIRKMRRFSTLALNPMTHLKFITVLHIPHTIHTPHTYTYQQNVKWYKWKIFKKPKNLQKNKFS